MVSVRMRVKLGLECRRAEARSWPMKPAAPVMRMVSRPGWIVVMV